MRRHNTIQFLNIFLVMAIVGCSGEPKRVEAPNIEPAEAAAAIMTQYDSNNDGQVSREELADCAALSDALSRYDEDGDKQISAEELTDRFAGWVKSGLGISSLTCRVTLKGKVLEGAEIKFVPEACFGETLQPATGITDDSGVAMLSIDAAHLPADAHNMRGIQQGLFRVEITHPSVAIPTKYNTETQLGKEVSFELGENVMRFSLK